MAKFVVASTFHGGFPPPVQIPLLINFFYLVGGLGCAWFEELPKKLPLRKPPGSVYLTNCDFTFIFFSLFFQIESVDLALELLDNYDVRGHKIRVQRAEFQLKGEYNPSLKPKIKKKEKEKMKKMQEAWVLRLIFDFDFNENSYNI